MVKKHLLIVIVLIALAGAIFLILSRDISPYFEADTSDEKRVYEEYLYYRRKGYPISTDVEWLTWYKSPKRDPRPPFHYYSGGADDLSKFELRKEVEKNRHRFNDYKTMLCADLEFHIIWFYYVYETSLGTEQYIIWYWQPTSKRIDTIPP